MTQENTTALTALKDVGEAAAPAKRNPPPFDKNLPGKRTFKGNVSLDFKIVMNVEWVKFWREEAQAEDASEFLKVIQEQHPVNDDAFIEALLRRGIRESQQQALGHLLRMTGLTGTVSPAKMEMMAHVPDFNAPVAIQVLEKKDV